MRFSRQELTEIITPHVLRTVVRLQALSKVSVTKEDLAQAGLSDREQQALVQTKRLLEQEDGTYRVQV